MKLIVVSDLHFAGPEEQSRRDHEGKVIGNPGLRTMARAWRRWIWLRDPQAHNHLLDRFIEANASPDLVVANGDYSLDTGFVGVSDPAAFSSASIALGRLRAAYGERLHPTIGDHELGKMSLFGGAGGLRLASWNRTIEGLGVLPFWQRDLGNFLLLGIASTPLALKVFEHDALPDELEHWRTIQTELQDSFVDALDGMRPGQKAILVLHDPSALPYLALDPRVLRHLPKVAATIVGHLHTPVMFRLGSALAGFPEIGGLGNTVRRYTRALRQARWWKAFRTELCPSLTGIQLLKDGGWLELDLNLGSDPQLTIRRHRLPW